MVFETALKKGENPSAPPTPYSSGPGAFALPPPLFFFLEENVLKVLENECIPVSLVTPTAIVL